MRTGTGRFVALLAGTAALLAGCDAEERWVQGQVEARQVRVAAKIPGRLDTVLVREGDLVARGQVLAILSSPEIEAKSRQAAGQVAAALAQRDKARNGARSGEIEAARANRERARAAYELAETTQARIERLFAQGVVPAQRRDEARTQRDAAGAALEAAEAQLRMAVEGARSEDRAAAQGVLAQAEGGRAEVEAYLGETRLRSPLGGEIATRIAEPGEVVPSGYPVLSVVDLSDAWVVLNVREDWLPGIRRGTRLTGRLPALGGAAETFEVFQIASAGDFATWRSARESGGFDLRTFEVRARPVRPVAGLRPGMTVRMSLSGAAGR